MITISSGVHRIGFHWFRKAGCAKRSSGLDEGLQRSAYRSAQSFKDFVACFDAPKHAHVGPFFGWLSVKLPLYPSTENLRTRVHLRDDGVHPYIELEPTDHPLAVEHRNGIAVDRVAGIYAYYEHGQQ
jgi:Uncharacterized protein conserved in bacteria (DUF2199)